VQAIWVEHDIRFTYVGQVTYYSCDGLRTKLIYILGQLNVRPGFKVSVNCVGEIGSPNLMRSNKGIEYMPHVRIRAATPLEATPEVLAILQKEAPRRELIARVTGTSKDLDTATAQFPAIWHRAVFSGSKGHNRRIGEGDCELFEHLRDRVFPKMGLKLEDDSRLLCDPNNVRVGSVHLTVDMLTPVPPLEPAEADKAGAAAGEKPKDATPPAPVAASSAEQKPADSTPPAPTAAAPAIEQKPATDDPMPVEVDPNTEAKVPDADPKPVQSPSGTPPD
jgi:hypothetical protein